MIEQLTHVAFVDSRRVAAGNVREVIATLKQRFDSEGDEAVLVFELESGRQVDFNLRGSPAEVLAREAPEKPVGPGRPKLGVVSREVSLLPRHWDWLEQQPNGISAAVRRLVEQAIKDAPGAQRARALRSALSRMLTALAGNRPNYEEATRALFSGDLDTFEGLVKRWPKDIRELALQLAREASELDGAH
jgi:uncharacterized protein